MGLDGGPSPRTVVATTVMLISAEATHDDDAISNKLLQLPPTHLAAGIMSEPHILPETESE